MISLLTILLPKDSVLICSVIIFWVPVLDWLIFTVVLFVMVLVLISVVTSVPTKNVEGTEVDLEFLKFWYSDKVPLLNPVSVDILVSIFGVFETSTLMPVVSHEFQITGATPEREPSAFVVISAFNARDTPRKFPSICELYTSICFISIQLSEVGFNWMLPSQSLTKNGVTFSVLVAKGCFNQDISL